MTAATTPRSSRSSASTSSVESLLESAGGCWLAGGEQPTLADLAAIPLAVRVPMWVPELAPDPASLPLACAWLAALRARPSAAEVDRRGAPVNA
ncbi:MAG: glutathione binding-like protein [Solirubrobacteraceae bacterium]